MSNGGRLCDKPTPPISFEIERGEVERVKEEVERSSKASRPESASSEVYSIVKIILVI